MAMTASHSGPQELSETSVYVYGVTWADGAAVPKSAGRDVVVVEQSELAAIVSPAPNGPVRTRRRELMRHLDVLQAVFTSKTVLPVQFGSVFPGRAAVADEPRTEYELMRASYLVERRKIAAFDARMDELARNERDRIDFAYTGPLPPHSFVSLTPRRT